MRRSHDRNAGLAALHLVSAWATANRVVLGQVATEAKSNEITAIPQLLALLHLKGCIVTIDAMGRQTKIAEQINAQGQNTCSRSRAIRARSARRWKTPSSVPMPKTTLGCTRNAWRPSRVETRHYRTLGDLSEVPRSALWQRMNIIGMVQSERSIEGKTTVETRYYIGSIGNDVACFARGVRVHCGVENVLHWSLDETFREDECRVRQPAARENLAVLRPIALTRLKQDDAKFSLRNKRNTAGWDHRYMAKLLFEAPQSPPSPRPSDSSNIRAD